MGLWDLGEFFGGFHPIEWWQESWEEAFQEMDRKESDKKKRAEGAIKKRADEKIRNEQLKNKQSDAKAYSRDKLKGFINKYNLSYGTLGNELNHLITDITMQTDSTNIKEEMVKKFEGTPLIQELDEKIQKERSLLSSQNKVSNYLKKIGE